MIARHRAFSFAACSRESRRSLRKGGCRLRNARYPTWREAFEVEFEDGIAFLETHEPIRRANKIKRNVRVKFDGQMRGGFFVHYDNGQTAEVSWSFIRELPPKGADATRA